ncbi:MAG: nucleotidyltransferase [Bacteroides sp. SM1_62]|nr:MAG: nucleotidyltransferase [Bacteroides sp. SM23_62]KPL20997.1 MAG: nucleotidyltransferase [Bacteroides sp. SM1_62]
MKLTPEYRNKIRGYLKDKPVFKAYLFGSYARDDAQEESDVDILLELDYTEHIGLEYVQMKIDLEKILNKSVDLVTEKALSKYIKPIVDKEKVLIYEKG